MVGLFAIIGSFFLARYTRKLAAKDAVEERRRQAELTELNARISDLRQHIRSVMAFKQTRLEATEIVQKQMDENAEVEMIGMQLSFDYRKTALAYLRVSPVLESQVLSGIAQPSVSLKTLFAYREAWEKELNRLLKRRKELTGY